MLEENTVTAADGHLAITLGIKREPDTRRGVEQVPRETASIRGRADTNRWEIGSRHERQGPSRSATLDEAVQRIACILRILHKRAITAGVERGLMAYNESARIEIKGLPVPLAVSPKQTHAHAKIEGETFVDAPVVL